jgi:hypothetical protein
MGLDTTIFGRSGGGSGATAGIRMNRMRIPLRSIGCQKVAKRTGRELASSPYSSANKK